MKKVWRDLFWVLAPPMCIPVGFICAFFLLVNGYPDQGGAAFALFIAIMIMLLAYAESRDN